MQNIPDFKRTLAELKAVTGRSLPQKIGVQATVFFKQRFREGNWVDDATHPWKKRKTVAWGKRERKGRGLLIDSGRLRRSIRVVRNTGSRIVVGTDVPYAKAHNEGYRGNITQNVKQHTRSKTKFGIVKRTERKRSTRVDYGRVKTGETTVKAHKRTIKVNIPKRQFIGQSAALNKQIERIMKVEISRIMNKL